MCVLSLVYAYVTVCSFCVVLEEGSRVRQKHNCLGIVFIAAIVTTCFGHAQVTMLTSCTNEKNTVVCRAGSLLRFE
jgi:hypothetical protein